MRLFPWHRRPGSHVPYQSLIELRAAYTPDAARSVSGHPPSLSRGKGHPAVLTSPNPLSTLQRQFACARLSRSCLPGSSSRRFRNAHYRGFWPKQLAVAWDQRPDRRTRRAFLHLPYSCAPPFGPAILVTQDPKRSLQWRSTRGSAARRRRLVCVKPNGFPSLRDSQRPTGIASMRRIEPA